MGNVHRKTAAGETAAGAGDSMTLPGGQRRLNEVTERDRVAARRRELVRLSGPVQAILRATAGRRWPAGTWGTALTIYDRMLTAGDRRGGHWTLFHTAGSAHEQIVESYAITLLFDSGDQALAFSVDGAVVAQTESATPGALAGLLDRLPPLRQVVRVPPSTTIALRPALVS